MTYYFGIPMDYANNISGTTSMFAFEVYGKREVSSRFTSLPFVFAPASLVQTSDISTRAESKLDRTMLNTLSGSVRDAS